MNFCVWPCNKMKCFEFFQAVCNKMGLNTGDRLSPESIKRKFLVSSLPDDKVTDLFTSFNLIILINT